MTNGTRSSLRCTLLCSVLLGVLAIGCGDDDSPPPEQDAGQDSGFTICRESLDCDDGVFCNGVERCQPNSPRADSAGCVSATAPTCDDGIACTEDVCSHVQNRCLFNPPDADGDGYSDVNCLGPNDEPLGDDCDDTDKHRFPSNREVCSESASDHDEDCDPETYGVRDADGDGASWDQCCNAGNDGQRHCGTDCDDTSGRVREGYPELCDGVDNDCNGVEDDDTIELPWYLDADGDGYGDPESASEMSCAIVADRSVVATDCDDTRAARHPAAAELCNNVDDDCDGMTDEGDACSCGAVGAVQPCVCADNRNGFHLCQGDGFWAECDCRECVSGSVDCVADLIPRTCMNGRWVSATACFGNTPRCIAGECMCLDGTRDCTTLTDPVAPYVQLVQPGNGVSSVPLDAVVAAVLSETIDSASVTAGNFRLLDSTGTVVSTTRYTQGNTVSLVPTGGLQPGRLYRAELSGVTDLAGNALAVPRTWEFMTVVTTQPTAVYEDAYDQLTLDAWPNGTALITYRIPGPLETGGASRVVLKLAGDTQQMLGRYYTNPCMVPCIGYGTVWALAPDGQLAVFTDASVWSGTTLANLTDQVAVHPAHVLRFANNNTLVWMRTDEFRLETRIGGASAIGAAGFRAQDGLVNLPTLATNAQGDLLAVALVDNLTSHEVRVVYGADGVIPASNQVVATVAASGFRGVLQGVGALREDGSGVAAWIQTDQAVDIDAVYQTFELRFVTVSDSGALGTATVARPLSAASIDRLQAVASGDTVWLVFVSNNQVVAIPVDPAGNAGTPVIVSDGARTPGNMGYMRASGESDGTLHVAWTETDITLQDVEAVVVSRRILPDRSLTPIHTLMAGQGFSDLHSATFGPREALTIVVGTGNAPGLHAFLN